MQHNSAIAETETGDAYAELCRQVIGSNIDPRTFLATDYLNHFNEAIMLLEMMSDAPDCLDMVQDWQPKTYSEHFRDSGFSDKDLAIKAYGYVPSQYLVPFEHDIECLNQEILAAVAFATAFTATMEDGSFQEEMTTRLKTMNDLIDAASAVIHGSAGGLEQDEVDALFDD